MRRPILALATIALVAGPTAIAFFSGGFFEKPRLIAGVSVWIIVAVAVVASPRLLPAGRAGRTALGGLALLTGWTALSYEWAPLGAIAQADIQRLLLYLGVFAAGILLFRAPASQRWIEPGLALGMAVVTCYGLSARLLPSLLTFQQSESAEGRLEQPLTYWNAMGCLSAMGLVLCMRIAADPRHARWVRAAGAFAAAPLGLGVYLSFSRGALFALAAGTLALLTLAPSRREQARAVGVALGAGAIGAVVANFLPRVESLPPGQTGSQTQGLVMLVTLLVLGSCAAFVTARVSFEQSHSRRLVASASRPVIVVACLVLLLGGVAGMAVLEGKPAAQTAGSPTSAKRFGSADSLRYSFWEVSLDAFRANPVVGTGTGGFAVEWRKQPDRPERAVDAHSLILETLGELGLVGILCLALFLGGIATATARLYAHNSALATGAGAVLITWIVHAALDWDWEMPAVSAVALILAAAVVAWTDATAPTQPSYA